MSSPNNPHDKLFKATFSEKDVVIDFINNFLPTPIQEKINLSSLRLQANSYISPSLTEFYSDVVYSAYFGEGEIQICLLFEHKSYLSNHPHLQILRYMVGAWFQMISQKEKLKPIIPIIVYHGKEKWVYQSFESLFDKLDPTLRPFLPTSDYLLTQINSLSDEQLEQMQIGILRQAFLLLKHGRDPNYLFQNFHTLFSSLEPYSQANQYSNLIISLSVYTIGVSGIPEETFIKLVQDLPPSVNEHIMTTYEQIIQKGKSEGKVEGKIEGIIENQNLMITNAFKDGFDISVIARLTGLTEEEVKNRIQELGLSK